MHWNFYPDWNAFTSAHFLLGTMLVWTVTARLRHAALLAFALLGAPSAWTESYELLAVPGLLGSWSLALYDLFLVERKAGRFPRTATAALGVPIVVMALFLAPTSYDYTSPGGVHPMDSVAQVQGGKPAGRILGLSIINGSATPTIHLVSWFSPEVTLRAPNTQAGYAEARESLLANSSSRSDLIAPAVALQYLGLGKGVVSTGKGAIAAWVEPGGPAAGHIQIGDMITAVDGRPVSDADSFRGAVVQMAPGAGVKVSLLRDEQPVEVTVTLGSRPDAPSKGFMGVTPEDDITADIPLPVSVDRSVVSGSSWGGMLALSLIDQFTPGGVTHGNLVAGTGTIKPDGSIDEISGVAQKAFLSEQAGADVVFVPASQAAEAGRLVQKIQVVPVERVDDMIAWLKAHPKDQ